MFTDLLDRIRSFGLWNIALAGLIVAVAGFLPACAGDLIKVDTPAKAVDSGFVTPLTLNKSVEAFNEHFANQAALQEVWSERIETGREKVLFVEGLAGAVISPEGLTLLGFNPVSGLGMGLIYILGRLQRKPGDSSPQEVQDEKIDSYNKGMVVATNLIKKGDPT
jgi:hypothetical protein